MSVACIYDLLEGHQLCAFLLIRGSSLSLALMCRVKRGFEESKPSGSL